jgi:RNA ligase (TIGR02306 family)
MRQLVTLENISEIRPIPDADAIEVARVRGWDVVVKKGEFKVNEEVLYFEIDSFLPISDPRFSFLEPRGVRVQDGVTGHVLKTVRLRGQYSQGLIKPVSEFPEGIPEIAKFDPPLPAGLEGSVEGQFLYTFAPKTDAERIQNLGRVLPEILSHEWIATEKIDGTSTTIVNDGGTIRICSRNWEISRPSARFDLADKLNLAEILPVDHTIQGEYYGENIQGNPLGIKGTDFKAFNLYKKTDNGPVAIPFNEWPDALVPLQVPVLPLTLPKTIDEILEQVDGLKSVIAPQRLSEGIVWQGPKGFDFLGNRPGFKALSNKYDIAKNKKLYKDLASR